MNWFKAIAREIALATSEEVARRDREIGDLRTALAGSQAEATEVWGELGRTRAELALLRQELAQAEEIADRYKRG